MITTSLSRRLAVATLAVTVLLTWPRIAMACSLPGGPRTAIEIAYEAKAIVRARAGGYVVARNGDDGLGLVRFEILEVVKGSVMTPTIDLRGQIDRYDGPNDRPVPYDFVRRGGRHGDCYARDYRTGQEFLLFLRRVDGRWDVNWAALAATNEEASVDWVQWVKAAVSDSEALRTSALAAVKKREDEMRKRLEESERRARH